MVASGLVCSATMEPSAGQMVEMNERRPTPVATPIRQRPNTGKLLELTPLWETVLKYNRFPQNVDKGHVFTELAVRLNDPEWEVRQHALRVLTDIMPVISKTSSAEDLDALMVPVVLTDVTHNLGHPAPAVRNSAYDVLLSYLKSTSDPEFVLRSIVSAGLESPAASNTLTASVIHVLPRLLEQTLTISHQSLVHFVTAVSKKITQMAYQKQAVETLNKIRDHVGESRFDHFLESYYPQVKRDLDVLCQVYQVEPSIRDSGIDLQSPPPVVQEEYWSESSPSPTPKVEPQQNNQRAEDEGEYDGAESDQESEEEKPTLEDAKLVLEKEIQIDSTTVTMRLMEEGGNAGDDEEEEEGGDEEDGKKTPRRVRFGGEVVKLRTPDSDITIELHEGPPHEQEPEKNENVEEAPTQDQPSFEVINHKRTRSSHIPVLISRGATQRPVASRRRYSNVVHPQVEEIAPVMIPTYDGGESLTSSSEGEQYKAREFVQFQQEEDLKNLSFLPQDLLQLLAKKEDWRTRVRALDRLSSGAAGRLSPEEGRHLLLYLVGCLSDDPRPPRLLASLLRATKTTLGQAPAGLSSLLPWLVPGVCRHLAGGSPLSARLEAVEAIKTLMRITTPAPVVNVLFSDRCLTSRSSKLRENSLLCLLYALMTFPSNEFDCPGLTDRIIAVAVTEPKRRVRQAVLETLAVLAQYVSRKRLTVEPEDYENPEEALFFYEGLQARLARRQLPAVSHEGLVLYSLQIPQMTGTDVDWVLAGSGSLSSGSARSRTQLENAQRAYLSQSSDNMFSWSRDPTNQNMMAVGVAVPPRNYDYLSNNYDERSIYDQSWPNDPRHSHPSFTQGNSRPLYVNYQTNAEIQRGLLPDKGFPQLNLNYSGVNGAYQRKGSRMNEANGSWQPTRWGSNSGGYDGPTNPPVHVSINQSLPPIAVPQQPLDWRNRSTSRQQYQQADSGYRIVGQDDIRKGRWSKRQENSNSRNRLMNGAIIRENGIRVATTQSTLTDNALSKSEVSLAKSDLSTTRSVSLTASSPSLHQLGSNTAVSDETTVLGRQDEQITSTPGTSVTSSLVSVNSQLQLEDVDAVEEEEVAAAAEEEEFSEEVIQRPPEIEPEEEVPPPPATPPKDFDANSLNNESKSTGTPNSEVCSESSRNTQGSILTLNSTHSDKTDDRPKRRIPRAIELRTKPKLQLGVKELKTTNLYPPTLPPLEHPKEAFTKALLQLDNPEWEVVMQGLQTLVRLSRHHGKLLQNSTHNLVVPLTKHVRNLRSQVSRGACQCTGELFLTLGRFLDSEVEDLAGALLCRMADTNKFLRADSSAALDAMVDSTSPVKSVAALVTKGAKHQNAIVRGATCRLLLRICIRLGPDRTMALPKETRDSILITGAKFLTEGSLETRRYAKEMFTILSKDSQLTSILNDIVPSNIMRSIHKVLCRIVAKQ
ncbi:uncharacterized protein isoform X2 [Rhodnius prolixus]|uniref:uncharacterized protein isoform X2 n=1 Tax=Rhodnius prolixus TaxID=13249 RepID=UPI003D18E4A2